MIIKPMHAIAKPPNETVEKPNFQTQRLVGDRSSVGILSRSAAGWDRLGLVQRPEHVDFADIVYQGKQLPFQTEVRTAEQDPSPHTPAGYC